MASATFENVSGFSELSKKLKSFAPELQKRALQRAVGDSARVVRNEARALFRQKWQIRSGRLSKAIVMKYIPEKSKPGRVVYYVVVKSLRGSEVKSLAKKLSKTLAGTGTSAYVKRRVDSQVFKVSGSAFYWRFLEFGTAYIHARPFMRPAFESKVQEAIEAMRARLGDEVKKIAEEMGL